MKKDRSTRGWMVVASCFCLGFIVDGIQYSYGLLFLEYLREFKQSKTATSWIGAIFFGWYMVGPVPAVLTNRFGCRPVVVAGGILSSAGFLCSTFSTSVPYLCISFGCIVGFGIQLINIPRDVVIIQYFDKRRSFAMGIAVCGSGIGTIVFNPFIKWLIDEYGWRGTMLIEAGLVLNFVPCGLVMRPFVDTTKNQSTDGNVAATQRLVEPFMQPDEDQDSEKYQETRMHCDRGHYHDSDMHSNESEHVENSDGHNEKSNDVTKNKTLFMNLSLLKQPEAIYILVCFFVGISYFIPFTFLPDMVVHKGWSRSDAVWLLNTIGIVNTVCRIPIGKFSDMRCVNRTFTLAVSITLLGLSSAVMPFLHAYGLLVFACVLFGIFIGFHMVLYALVGADVYGEEHVTDVFGFIYLTFGLGSFISGPISGALFDATGDYRLTFATAGVGFLVGGMLTLILFVISKRRRLVK